MFKLKKGNVFQKLNSMDRKQAYTYGGIIVAVIVVLLLLASFLSQEEDPSFDGFNSRGYDLADSPFVTDEAEQYLLSSMYPDMQNNGASALYSPAEKEARQEEDAQNEEEESGEEESSGNEEEYDSGEEEEEGSSSRSGGGRAYYGGRGGGGGTKTEIGTLGSASMGHAGGSGINSTWGSPRVDTNPFKRREMEKDKIQTQTLNKNDARRALSQFAAGSRAAAGLKDNRDMNMKRASMGGDINAVGAFKEDGTVDLSKVDASRLDTNAPQGGSPDLNTLKDATQKAADKEHPKEDDKLSFWEKFAEKAMEMGMQLVQHLATNFLDNALSNWQEKNQFNSKNKAALNAVVNKDPKAWTDDELNMLYNAGYNREMINKWHTSGNLDYPVTYQTEMGLSGNKGHYKASKEYTKTYQNYCNGGEDVKPVNYNNNTNSEKTQEIDIDGKKYVYEDGIFKEKK